MFKTYSWLAVSLGQHPDLCCILSKNGLAGFRMEQTAACVLRSVGGGGGLLSPPWDSYF